MRLSLRLVAAVLLAIAATSLALSIQVERSEAAVGEVKSFEYDASSSALMAPHDVKLVRRVGWTYRNSMF